MAPWWHCRRWFRRLRERRRAGARAERGAARHLRRKGLRLIARNYRVRSGEIDLVMHEGGTIVFVEVRYRGESAWVSPIESITPAKRARVVRAARAFLAAHHLFATRPCRFDVVSVTRRHYRFRYAWIRDAFPP